MLGDLCIVLQLEARSAVPSLLLVYYWCCEQPAKHVPSLWPRSVWRHQSTDLELDAAVPSGTANVRDKKERFDNL